MLSVRCVVGHGSIGPIRREVVVQEGEVQGWGWGWGWATWQTQSVILQ